MLDRDTIRQLPVNASVRLADLALIISGRNLSSIGEDRVSIDTNFAGAKK
jgi:hypothetical protein